MSVKMIGKGLKLGVVAACAVTIATSALAASVTGGTVVAEFADPSDFVVELDKAGECGSKYYHFKRPDANFKESVAVALTAFATGKQFVVFVVRCESDRNVASHGYVVR